MRYKQKITPLNRSITNKAERIGKQKYPKTIGAITNPRKRARIFIEFDSSLLPHVTVDRLKVNAHVSKNQRNAT